MTLYNITVPNVTKRIQLDLSGMPQEMIEFLDKDRVVELGSIELKNVTKDVAQAIMMLCEASDIPMLVEIVDGD